MILYKIRNWMFKNLPELFLLWFISVFILFIFSAKYETFLYMIFILIPLIIFIVVYFTNEYQYNKLLNIKQECKTCEYRIDRVCKKYIIESYWDYYQYDTSSNGRTRNYICEEIRHIKKCPIGKF